jgi:hypothetical protein
MTWRRNCRLLSKGCSFSRCELQGVVDMQSAVFDDSTLEKEFIEELCTQSLPPLPEFVELQDSKHKFKTWRESTRRSSLLECIWVISSPFFQVYTN